MKKQTIFICVSIMCFAQFAICQVSNPTNTFNLLIEYVGWDITPGSPDLNIKHELNQPIHFYTNAGNSTFNNQRMIIDANPGHVGIGLNHVPGNDILDILPDVNFPNTGIGINNETVLHNWGTQNIFVGVGAGFNNDPAMGSENAFFGKDAGFNNRIGGQNTFMGYRAGYNNEETGNHTFVGYRAGYSNTNATENTFVGADAGRSNTTGSHNVFLGASAGVNNTTGFYNLFSGTQAGGNNTTGFFNVFVGHTAGLDNIKGNNNVFVGLRAGEQSDTDNNTFVGFQSGIGSVHNFTGHDNAFLGARSGLNINTGSFNAFSGSESGLNNTRGERNTFLGYQSGMMITDGRLNTFVGAGSGSGAATSLINAAAIGANATVLNDNKMILGDNQINVGIGLSNVSGGPHHKLHIQDADNPQLRLSHTYNINVANGVWTDFRNTDQGDLLINTQRMNGQNPEPHFVGINCSITFPPLNTFDINSTALSPRPSGLRLRNLTATSPNDISPNGKVLTVDANGHVVLTDDVGGGGSVSSCSVTAFGDENFITKWTSTAGTNREICRTNGIFEVNATPWNVSIGAGITPPFKLTVQHSVAIGDTGHYYQREPGGGYYRLLSATGGGNGYSNLTVGRWAGPDGLMTSVENNTFIGNLSGRNCASDYNTFIGAQAGESFVNHTSVINTQNLFAGYFAGRNMVTGRENTVLGSRSALNITDGERNTIVGFESLQNATIGNFNSAIGYRSGIGLGAGQHNTYIGTEAGPIALAGLATRNRSTAVGFNAKVNCDDCISTGDFNDRHLIGYATIPQNSFTRYRLYVNSLNAVASDGAAYFNGNIFVTGQYLPSDTMLKQNVQPFTGAMQWINQLDVKSYNYDTITYNGLSLPPGNQVGLMAHEVESVIPELVREVTSPEQIDSSGNVTFNSVTFKSINYLAILPYLIEALQEHDSKIDSIVTVLGNCCNLRIPNNPDVTGSIELENIQSLQLFTADPNPFSESTIIRWSIADDFNNAVIFFYDDRGQQINQYRITEKGNGELQVFGSKLSSGVYTYTLVVDGKIVESRKMVKVK
ncbi:MAG: tail fiber domain-containing protein [Bacteroidia bacterium]|nr:tail fiber domain-containing protein [Bacteroidia bacterium]